MKKKKLISTIILFGLALSSCENCATDRNATSDKNMFAQKDMFHFKVKKMGGLQTNSHDLSCLKKALNIFLQILNSFGDHGFDGRNISTMKTPLLRALEDLVLIWDRDSLKNVTLNNLNLENCKILVGKLRDIDPVLSEAFVSVDGGNEQFEGCECTICYDPIKIVKDPIICSKCHNPLCRKCVADTLEKCVGFRCPLCRAEYEKLSSAIYNANKICSKIKDLAQLEH